METLLPLLGSMLSMLWGYFQPLAIQWVKNNPSIPWITNHTRWLNLAFALVMSAGAAMGLTFAFNADTDTLTIGGLDFSKAMIAALTFLGTWITSELRYRLRGVK